MCQSQSVPVPFLVPIPVLDPVPHPVSVPNLVLVPVRGPPGARSSSMVSSILGPLPSSVPIPVAVPVQGPGLGPSSGSSSWSHSLDWTMNRVLDLLVTIPRRARSNGRRASSSISRRRAMRRDHVLEEERSTRLLGCHSPSRTRQREARRSVLTPPAHDAAG